MTLHEGNPISIELPQRVTLEIVEADPVVKGQTASSSYKPAKLSNGARVMVPPHIGAGTRVVVMTADGSYVERARTKDSFRKHKTPPGCCRRRLAVSFILDHPRHSSSNAKQARSSPRLQRKAHRSHRSRQR